MTRARKPDLPPSHMEFYRSIGITKGDVLRYHWRSHIYFVQPLMGGLIKIGTTQHIVTRFLALQTGSPIPLHLLGTTFGGRMLEQQLHQKFNGLREHGEWFQESEQLMDLIRLCPNYRPLPRPAEEDPDFGVDATDEPLPTFPELPPHLQKRVVITAAEYSELTGISFETVCELVKQGALRGIGVGKRMRLLVPYDKGPYKDCS